MATNLLAWAEWQSSKKQLRDMSRPARASVTLAAAVGVLLETEGQAADAGQLWRSIERVEGTGRRGRHGDGFADGHSHARGPARGGTASAAAGDPRVDNLQALC